MGMFSNKSEIPSLQVELPTQKDFVQTALPYKHIPVLICILERGHASVLNISLFLSPTVSTIPHGLSYLIFQSQLKCHSLSRLHTFLQHPLQISQDVITITHTGLPETINFSLYMCFYCSKYNVLSL
jgi:hypothetical protein